ncbi:MAG: DUF5686 family protein [Bacteroidota bacterium]
MHWYIKFLKITVTLFFLFPNLSSYAQKNVTIKGKVIDAQTQEVLPFATVSLVSDQGIGTTTELDGNFELTLDDWPDSLVASYIGYQSLTLAVDKSATFDLVFSLSSNAQTLQTVEVVAKKKRYRRKNNPAVELIKKVMANKKYNRPESQDYYEYEKYEKVEFAINNFSNDFFEKRKLLKKFQFLEAYMDTTGTNQAATLPFYLREIISKVYYRKNPEAKKEYRQAIKMTGIDEWLDDESISGLNDVLYQEIDIYQNNIFLFKQNFLSPINDALGNMFYRYYILDTIQYKGQEVIEMTFLPANKQDMGFKGNLLILNDSTYALVKANLSFTKQVNINWVEDLKIVQEYERKGNAWVMVKDEISTDFLLSKKAPGIFAKRTVMYRNQKFNQPRDAEIYKGAEEIVDIPVNAAHQDEAFWQQARHVPLTAKETQIYQMVDTLKTVRPFRNTMNALSILSTGYFDTKYFEIGTWNTFLAENDVEGIRLSFGGTTSPDLFPKVQLEGYAAYGLKDKKLKYHTAATYTFNENWRDNPRHYFRFSYLHDNKLIGQPMKFEYDDSYFFSFIRGISSRAVRLNSLEVNYVKEFKNDFRLELTGLKQNHRPIGSLEFNYSLAEFPNGLETLFDLNITSFQARLRWAPNETFVQGRNYRHPIFTRFPVFNFYYTRGLKDVFGGDYNFDRLEASVFKRIFMAPFGYTDMFLSGGKVWGTGIPYYMLLVPRGNQGLTALYFNHNLMNFMEFTNDFHLSWNFQHFFKGYIFNKVPLLRKLKLREIVSFKGVWGRLSDQNNPEKNSEFIQFLRDENDEPITSSLQSKPYMEFSVGVGNIFKVLRVDLIKRLTYLDNPEIQTMFGVKGLGLKVVGGFSF